MTETFIDLRALGATIDTLIAVYDAVSGDPDLEHGGDDELTGDEYDAAWTEYHTRGRNKLASGTQEPFHDHEDAELGGDETDGNCSEDDFMHHYGTGPGCPISDPDAAVDDQPCDYDDGY